MAALRLVARSAFFGKLIVDQPLLYVKKNRHVTSSLCYLGGIQWFSTDYAHQNTISISHLAQQLLAHNADCHTVQQPAPYSRHAHITMPLVSVPLSSTATRRVGKAHQMFVNTCFCIGRRTCRVPSGNHSAAFPALHYM